MGALSPSHLQGHHALDLIGAKYSFAQKWILVEMFRYIKCGGNKAGIVEAWV